MPTKTSLGGRPVRTNYGPDEQTTQLNVWVDVSLKRALADAAEQNGSRLADEVRDALAVHVGAARTVSVLG